MFNSSNFGKSIKNLRKVKGYSQLNLALELNITESYLSKIERGDKIPTIEITLSISNYFNVGIDELSINKNNINTLSNKINDTLNMMDINDYKFLYNSLLDFIEFEKNGDSCV